MFDGFIRTIRPLAESVRLAAPLGDMQTEEDPDGLDETISMPPYGSVEGSFYRVAQTYYHVSPTSNRAKIQQEGLTVGAGGLWGIAPGIYLWGGPDDYSKEEWDTSWDDMALDEADSYGRFLRQKGLANQYDIWRVEIDPCTLEQDHSSVMRVDGAWVSHHPIPATTLTLVERGVSASLHTAYFNQTAADKIRNAPKPQKADFDRYNRSIKDNPRAGGELRGNVYDRRSRSNHLLKEFGDGKHCPCYKCGRTLDSKSLTEDKIYPENGYRIHNVLPSCIHCNQARSNRHISDWYKDEAKPEQKAAVLAYGDDLPNEGNLDEEGDAEDPNIDPENSLPTIARVAAYPGQKEHWEPGDKAWFEYHCLESDDSGDAPAWHHSHQEVEVLRQEPWDGGGDWEGSTQEERGEEGLPYTYIVRFSDGLEWGVFEDELYTDKSEWYRPDPPPDKTASKVEADWTSVQAKASIIYWSGGVRIIGSDGSHVAAHVRGDHGTYQSELMFTAGTYSIATWNCSCPWASYSWGRSGRWKKYEGRMCSHCMALLYQVQSDSEEEVYAPDWDEKPLTMYTPPPQKEWRVAMAWDAQPGNGKDCTVTALMHLAHISYYDAVSHLQATDPADNGIKLDKLIAAYEHAGLNLKVRKLSVVQAMTESQQGKRFLAVGFNKPGSTAHAWAIMDGSGYTGRGDYPTVVIWEVSGRTASVRTAVAGENPASVTKRYYHVTTEEAVPSIEQSGLNNSLSEIELWSNVDDWDEGVYLWDDLDNAKEYAKTLDQMGHKPVIYEVDDPDNIEPDLTGSSTVPGAFYTTSVPANRLRRIPIGKGKTASKTADSTRPTAPLFATANPTPGEETAREYAVSPGMSDYFAGEMGVISLAYKDLPILDQNAVGLWEQLGKLVTDQANELRKTYKITVYDSIDPYATAAEMHADMDKHCYQVTKLHSHHPVWDVDTNVNFRITHDILGHGTADSDFSFRGEVEAYQAQCKVTPEELWPVLFTEVVAQSAYANIHHLFGEQKVGLIDLTPEEIEDLVGKVTDAATPDYDEIHKSTSLDLEAVISVAEQAMERGGNAGPTISVPQGHVDDPTYKAAMEPLTAQVQEYASWAGVPHPVRIYTSAYTLKYSGNPLAMVTAMGSIVTRPTTNLMTILHEVAHLATRTQEGPSGHTLEFVEKAAQLYGRFISEGAAQQFRSLVGLSTTSSYHQSFAATEAEALAKSLMSEWGLTSQGWVFNWNNRAVALGVCHFPSKTLFLSKPLCEVNSMEQITDTIKHEIAHALVGPEAGHGRIWQLKAVEVGARPRATTDEAVGVAPKVVGTCPNCGTEYGRQRMPRDTTKWGCPANTCRVIPFDTRRLEWSRKTSRKGQKTSVYEGKGGMIAIRPPQPICDAIALPGGEEVGELHFTLAYIPDMDSVDLDALRRVVEAEAMLTNPLKASISGYGIFANGEKNVLYAALSSDEVLAFRRYLVQALDAAGIEYSKDFDYTPHCTLLYTDESITELPEFPKDKLEPFEFGSLILAVKGKWEFYPLQESKTAGLDLSKQDATHCKLCGSDDLNGVEEDDGRWTVYCNQCGQDQNKRRNPGRRAHPEASLHEAMPPLPLPPGVTLWKRTDSHYEGADWEGEYRGTGIRVTRLTDPNTDGEYYGKGATETRWDGYVMGRTYPGQEPDWDLTAEACQTRDEALRKLVQYIEKKFTAILHEAPEPALPTAEGELDDQMDDTDAALITSESALAPGGTGLAWLMASDSNQGVNSVSPTLTPTQSALNEEDMDIAKAAKQFLIKESVKNFSYAEQQALINEGETEGVVASNLGDLQLDGTHYLDLEARLQESDETDDYLNW